MMALTYIDLFCGAGGLSRGFDRAGFRNLFSVEIHPAYAETYRKNFPLHTLLVEDIRQISDERVINLAGGEGTDVVVGGPPCQGFSKAGNIGRSFLEDERNFLFREFVRVVRCTGPKMFLMENVAALATHNGGKTLQTVIHAFEDAGYRVNCHEVLNSSHYGIAQERRRIVIVGHRSDLDIAFSYPKKTTKQRTVADAIGDLPPLKSGEKSNIPNHMAMKHSEQMLRKMSYIRDGGSREDIPEKLRPQSGDIRKYIRYNSCKPSVCVTGDMRKIFHYSQNRALTPRELARLQSFEDDFIFEGTSIQIQQQIGNAVPPLLAYQLAVQIDQAIKTEKVILKNG